MEHLTKNTFEHVVASAGKPVIIDFWATWCGPCQMLAPILEELEKERPDLVIAKVNVDEEMELAMQYKVVSIPTVLLVKDGKVAAKAVGYMTKEELCRTLGI